MERETLARNHPISEFIRNLKVDVKNHSQEEFLEKYDAYLEEQKNEDVPDRNFCLKNSSSSPFQTEKLNTIVLKFTTLSEAACEASAFYVSASGARIGRDSINDISVPSDKRLVPVAHALIQHSKGQFYISDCGYDFAASIRIGVGGNKMKWIIEEGCQFSAGDQSYYDGYYFCNFCMYGLRKK